MERFAEKGLKKLFGVLEIFCILTREVVIWVYISLCKNLSKFTIKIGVIYVIKFYLD